MPTKRRRAVHSSLAAIVLLLTVIGLMSEPRSDLIGASVLGNLREVDPGRFYRSGQLTGEQLQDAIETLGIRTVINLRGQSTYHDWWQEENAVTREAGVVHKNVHLSARDVPIPQQLAYLLHLYRDAERPILVHCKSGIDRAGVASAIYQIEYMNRTPEQALEMLTLRFRHVSWRRPAMRLFVSQYRGEDWARSEYDPCASQFEGYHPQQYCTRATCEPLSPARGA